MAVEVGKCYEARWVAYLQGNTPWMGFILSDMQPNLQLLGTPESTSEKANGHIMNVKKCPHASHVMLSDPAPDVPHGFHSRERVWISHLFDMEQLIQQTKTLDAQAFKEDCSWMSYKAGWRASSSRESRMHLSSLVKNVLQEGPLTKDDTLSTSKAQYAQEERDSHACLTSNCRFGMLKNCSSVN
ncbi:unnamed protein product [Darwinula stevensoni]|uniref:Uncharacterized protein n=1 Tax=Darwinula stevensoni TaxID=69355 RepID=A0A7R9A328_9CRUS|nr:unnamed protein product [Darwinula stevensoni]CAG0889887.1 unnamed protein product [Darwinula stevensoni]